MTFRLVLAGTTICIALGACAPQPQDRAQVAQRTSTAALCAAHSTASGADLLLIEAELGVRDSLQCTSSYGVSTYVGQKTSSTVGRKLYTRSSPTSVGSEDKNCSDFSSSAQAQRFFLSVGGPVSDTHNLDGDGDGNACEWGKTLTSSVKRYKPKPAPVYRAARSYSSSRCYVGPRGGTYTITASGSKNYGGC